jgi:hypothetical protein
MAIRRALWSATVLTATMLFTSPLQAGGNLITNGSFESGSYTFDGNGADSLQPGSTAITGWTTFAAELTPISNTNNFGIQTPFGNIFLDLTGYHDSSPYGGVNQSISTTSGQSYSLTLYLGVDQSVPQYSGPISVAVSAGSDSTTFTDNPTGTGVIWTPFSFTFTANSSSTTVSIQGTQGIDYIGLDNVSVFAVSVPEPSSLLLGSVAAIVGGGITWLRRKELS